MIAGRVEGNGSEERAWLRAAQRGDKAAFGQIVRRYHRLVVSVAWRLSGDPELANDVAQETFLAAWLGLPSFRPEGDASLRAWLCRIAHNRAVDALRSRRPQVSFDRLTLVSESDRGGLPVVDSVEVQRAETRPAVQAAVLALPDDLRAVIVLREFEGLSYAEIAAALAIPPGTVMSRLHTARRRLAVALAPLVTMEVTA